MLEGRTVFLFTEGLEEGWSYLVKISTQEKGEVWRDDNV